MGFKIATNHITKTHFVVNFAGWQMEIIIDAILIRISMSVYPLFSLPSSNSLITDPFVFRTTAQTADVEIDALHSRKKA